MQRAPTRIRWYRPAPTAEQKRAGAFAGAEEDRNLQLETLLALGVPIAEGMETAPDFAIELLKFAAEAEHALMVQYLYTANSIDPAATSADYRDKLMSIAIEEMGHLMTVQNLLLLLGARPHLQRDVMRKTDERYPIAFVLEPVSKTALAKYVAAEKPASVPSELRAKVAELLEMAGKDGVEPERVGTIYAVLQWMFMPAKEAEQWIPLSSWELPLPENPHLTDKDLRPSDVAARAAQRREWCPPQPSFILEAPLNCADAVKAIKKVAEQGEGLDDCKCSHFFEFLNMVEALERGKIAARPMAKSPTLVPGCGGEGGEEITHPYTRLWGEVFNLQYSLLVLTIYHYLLTPRPSDETPGLRGSLVKLAMGGMKNAIGPTSEILWSLHMHEGNPDRAGPPYDLDPGLLQIASETELPERHKDLLVRLATLYQKIESSREFTDFVLYETALVDLRNLDEQRRKLFAPTASAFA